jgi:hypothetical protein
MVVSASATIQGIREIADLVRKYNDYPLYEKIVHLQEQVIDLSTERGQLRDENESLKEQLGHRSQTSFRNPYYYAEGDEVPLCPRCYETSSGGLRVHLTHPAVEMQNGFGRVCRSCKWFFLEGPERPRGARTRLRRPPRSGGSIT